MNKINLGDLLISITKMMDITNKDISYHQQRTAFITLQLCRELKLTDFRTRELFIAALLHDLGAITTSEKISLHRQEEENPEKHCRKGELLLNRYPPFHGVAKIVRYHHWEFGSCEIPSDYEEYIFSAQILSMADRVELAIERGGTNILSQKKRIIEIVEESAVHFNPIILSAFDRIAEKESFWLDLVCSMLPQIITADNPLRDEYVSMDEVELYSKLVRDLIDFKSPFTAAHSASVSYCAAGIGEILGLAEADIRKLRIAGDLHDLGKLQIDDSILLKEGSLSDEEYNIVKKHPYMTFRIIHSVKGLEEIAEIAGFHHERRGGNGYPYRINAEEQSILVRILIVSDVLVSVTENRPYRIGMTEEKSFVIIDELLNQLDFTEKEISLITMNFSGLIDNIRTLGLTIRNFYQMRILDEPDRTSSEMALIHS
ncbi:MAG: HD domain-containing protein [Spirochaetales bacterium]|nr:HD domain-containing protein [Spirochaetales bacterium]